MLCCTAIGIGRHVLIGVICLIYGKKECTARNGRSCYRIYTAAVLAHREIVGSRIFAYDITLAAFLEPLVGFAPSPGVSACCNIVYPSTAPSALKPTSTLTSPPKPPVVLLPPHPDSCAGCLPSGGEQRQLPCR